MLTHPKVEPTQATEPDAEALIREARRLRRRRWGIGLLILAVTGTSVGWIVATNSGGGATARVRVRVPSAIRFDTSARPLGGPAVLPDSAWSMTAGPDGSIYVVDQTREEVLRWSPGDGFFDVAGDGHDGFSGDGGLATKASFDFSWASSLAVGRNGTLYISDTGNGRIRAVTPNGIVHTVIGGGSATFAGGTASALGVSIGSAPQSFGLAIGPNGELYLGAAAGVYRLDGDELIRVVGVDPGTYKWTSPPYNYAEPLPIRFDGVSRLAFDGEGDLFVGYDAPYDAYELTAAGKRLPVGNIRGSASVAPLAEAPTGNVVIGTGTDGFEWLSPSGKITQVTTLGSWERSERSGLSKLLDGHGYFRPSDGIAVSTAGDIFIDADAGNGWQGVSAIAEVTSNGVVRAIWKS